MKLQDLVESSRNSRMRGYKRRNFRMGGETEEIQEAGVKHGKIQGFGGKMGKFQNLVFDNRLSNIKSPEIFTRHLCR